jgi:asparagine synthase (glutamine-hydrolysing)
LQIQLSKYKINPWIEYAQSHIRGEISKRHDNESWSEYFERQDTFFAFIYEDDNKIVAAADIVCSFPLVYSHKYKIITDKIECIKSEESINDVQKLHFQYAFSTLGSNTLFPEWQTILPGQYIVYNKKDDLLTKHYYTLCGERQKTNKNIKEIFHDIEEKIEFRCKNKQVILPLTGGYDSRCIAAILYQKNIKNVLCITYGKEDSYEVKTAKHIAQKLGFEWLFIPFDKDVFAYYFSDEYQKYSTSSHLYRAVPYEQDQLALAYLLKNNKLKDAYIVLSGFGGDYISGCHFTKNSVYNISNYVIDKHYGIITSQEKILIKKSLEGYFKNLPLSYPNNYQQWLLENRKSKFLLSALRGFEFLGGEWHLPFFDKTLMSFFDNLPFEEKLQQKYYVDFIFENYFKPLEIAILKPKSESHYYANYTIKSLIKSVLPQKLISEYKLRKFKNEKFDNCNMNLLYTLIYEKLEDKSIAFDYNINKIHALYLLKNIQK